MHSHPIPPDLAPSRIAAMLTTQYLGRSFSVLAETESTNDDAHRASEQGVPAGHVVIADTQRKGRGSKGRIWRSEAGSDLYFSVVLRPSFSPRVMPLLTLATGLAVAEALDVFFDDPICVIKWPNDVLAEGRKCAGILVEAVTVGLHTKTVIVGVGMNVNRTHFSGDLSESAGSIAQITGRRHDRAIVLTTFLGKLEKRLEALEKGEVRQVLDALSARLAWVGDRVACDGVEGVLRGIDDEGSLVISSASVTRVVRVGQLVRL